jgi:3-deoxy-D-manno-octulosonate 8-phosphate phosphatase (KDO 8-P phosphatase)
MLEKFADIRTFIFDVDGVLTDSSLYVLENGTLLRKMNTRDGMAMQMAVQKGYEIIIITGGKSEGVLKRLQNLGIKKVYSGVQNKLKVLEDLVAYEGLDLSGVLYMGDDINDYACLRSVHISACPADAATEIKALAQYISPLAGGAGCVRDIIERVMRLQGKWQILE